MARVSFLLVPEVCEDTLLGALSAVNVVYLDRILYCGERSDFFRRMRMRAFLEVGFRAVFDEFRSLYLKECLSRMDLNTGTVLVVGSTAQDVDLIEYDQVAVAKFDDEGLNQVGRLMYGDPYLTYMEYTAVGIATSQSVDMSLIVGNWFGLGEAIRRWLGNDIVAPPCLLPGTVFTRMSTAMFGLDQAAIASEPPLVFLESGLQKSKDYGYLTVIKPEWRDACTRVLPLRGDGTVQLEALFRLPTFVVDMDSVDNWHYRVDERGVMMVELQGESLTKFVKEGVPTLLPPADYVGTWIGGLLYDPIEVEQLVEQRVSIFGKFERSKPFGPFREPEVTSFAAVPNGVPDEPKYETARFLRALEVASLPRYIVQLFMNLQGTDLSGFLDVNRSVIDFLPGYQYLLDVRRSHRTELLRKMGSFDRFQQHFNIGSVGWLEPSMYIGGVHGMKSALTRLFWTNPAVITDYRPDWGGCYRVLYRPIARCRLFAAFGLMAPVRDLVAVDPDERGNAWKHAHVTRPVCYAGRMVAHVTLVETNSTVPWVKFIAEGVNQNTYIGLDVDPNTPTVDGCSAAPWYALAIIAWSVLGFQLLFAIGFLIYRKCSSPRRLGYGR